MACLSSKTIKKHRDSVTPRTLRSAAASCISLRCEYTDCALMQQLMRSIIACRRAGSVAACQNNLPGYKTCLRICCITLNPSFPREWKEEGQSIAAIDHIGHRNNARGNMTTYVVRYIICLGIGPMHYTRSAPPLLCSKVAICKCLQGQRIQNSFCFVQIPRLPLPRAGFARLSGRVRIFFAGDQPVPVEAFYGQS